MKLLQLSFVLLIFFSCSSKKKVIEAKANEIDKTSTIIDSLPKNTISKGNIPKSSTNSKPEEIVLSKQDSTTKKINQILAKRYLTPHQLWSELLQKNVSKNGIVNYKSFKTNHKKLLDYIHVLNLTHSDNDFQSLSREEKLAFWINAYNAMTVDLILRHYPVNSIKDIKNPWEQRHWKLSDKWYNLNEIEHEILRKMDEPRIHFAIVCASVSCPKLQNTAFTSENLNNQLTLVTKEFLNDSTKNELSEDNLKLSKIFQWFAKDFKQNSSLINFLNKYSAVKISAKAKKSFKNYNWDLNE